MNIQIILTDKFPNLKAFENVRQQTDGAIQFISESVDATDIPDTLHGFRTLFVSFHHFRPEIAKRILANSVDSGSVIGIFEATERSLMNFIAVLTTPLVVMLAVPFIKPFSFSRLIFTYLIPAIPLFTTWDGIVSVLRTYSVREMKEMTGQIGAKNYIWEIGKVPSKKGPNLLYLLGYPSTAPGGQ